MPYAPKWEQQEKRERYINLHALTSRQIVIHLVIALVSNAYLGKEHLK
jgi:hypothetical protein